MAAKQVEVSGRKLRTSNPDHVRELVKRAEERDRQFPGDAERFRDRLSYKGASFEAIRLKKGLA